MPLRFEFKSRFSFSALFVVIVGWAIGFAQTTNPYAVCPTANHEGALHVFQGEDDWVFYAGDIMMNIPIAESNQERIKELAAAFKYLGIDIVFINAPARGMLHYENFDLKQAFFQRYDKNVAAKSYENSLEMLRSFGFTAPNLLDYVLKNNENKDYGYQRDSHWSPDGASIVAAGVKEAVNELVNYQTMQFGDFKTRVSETKNRGGDLIHYARQVCPELQMLFMKQHVHEVYTEASNFESLLFGDTDISTVPLWGTSYSNTSNFREFLEAELDVNILNYAVNGGGLWSAMISYFIEIEAVDDLPKVALWEIPYNVLQLFNYSASYSEVIPTVYGSCDGELAVSPISFQELQVEHTNLVSKPTFRRNWNLQRATAELNIGSENETVVKVIYDGEKDPWFSYLHKSESMLEGKEYTFSIMLWTDEGQPKDAALYMYSDPENIEKVEFSLTTEPQIYTISHRFENTNLSELTVRVDGIQGQWTEESQGQYYYASMPELVLVNEVKLLENQNPELKGMDYYSYLDFEDLSILNYELRYDYVDGSQFSIPVNRTGRITNNGRYFHELPPYNSSPLEKMYIQGLNSSALGQVSVQICKKPNMGF